VSISFDELIYFSRRGIPMMAVNIDERNLARSILCSLVTSVDFGWYSSIVGVCRFFGASSCCLTAARGESDGRSK